MRAVTVFLLVLAHLALCQGWTCSQGPRLNNAVQVDAGLGEVVAIDKGGQAYFLSGPSWIRLPNANLKHISVGQAGIWGTNYKDKHFYQYAGGNWARFPGQWNQVDAGGDGFIVAVRHTANHVYCLRSEYTKTLTTRVYGQSRVAVMYYLSCGPFGCWGMTRRNQIIFNGLNSATCKFTNWRGIGGGSFQMVEVGSDGKVFGVNMSGQVLERTGISKARPYGSSWRGVPLCSKMRQVSYDLGTIYAVSTSGAIMKCTE